MKCIICESEIKILKKYDKHIAGFDLIEFLKVLLSYINFLIPKYFVRLKRISNMKLNIIKGFIGICSNCGHGFLIKPPTNSKIQSYYKNVYWEKRNPKINQISIKEGDDSRAIHQIKFVLDQISFENISRVLEIGAGAANAILLLRKKCKKNSVQLFVCEPGKQWEEYYYKNGIKKVANYFPFKSSDLKYDYIHTSHWLEHVINLDEVILELNKIIDLYGHIFVEVPNTEHFYWNLPLKDTPHIHFFTRKSLILAFEKYGFECLKIGEFGITYLEKINHTPVTSNRYSSFEKGFWICAIFRKIENL